LADTVADETLAPVTSVVQAGRSLRLVEEREAQIKLLTELVWVLTLGATAVAAIAVAAVL